MKKFRLLKPDEIEVRVARVKESGVEVLLYKTARTDANLLDETVGCENWENDFKLVDGVLYGGIGVNYGNGLVWKWDAGVESNTEAEKGRASDAFKRAGFKHGIGRELYSAPFVWIPSSVCKIEQRNGKFYCNSSFTVSVIEYDENENISKLVICNQKTGAVAYEMGVSNYTQQPAKPPQSAPAGRTQGKGAEFVPTCKDCGKEITEKEHDFAVRYYGVPLCRSCQKNHARN